MATDIRQDQAEHNRRTREAYDRLAPVWLLDQGADAGFAVERVAEPQPSQEALRLFPEEVAGLGVLGFIVHRLWLRP